MKARIIFSNNQNVIRYIRHDKYVYTTLHIFIYIILYDIVSYYIILQYLGCMII